MKSWLACFALAALFFASTLSAAERKPLKEVNVALMMRECELLPATNRDPDGRYIGKAFWIPHAYWQVIFAKNETMPDKERQDALKQLDGVFLVGLLLGEHQPAPNPTQFYDRKEILKGFKISVIDTQGKRKMLSITEKTNPFIDFVLKNMRPMVEGTIGEAGKHLEIVVIDNRNPDGSPIIDAYGPGRIDIRMVRESGQNVDSYTELPMNSLYVPRKCPNGRDADISWKFCPWTGQRLPE